MSEKAEGEGVGSGEWGVGLKNSKLKTQNSKLSSLPSYLTSAFGWHG